MDRQTSTDRHGQTFTDMNSHLQIVFRKIWSDKHGQPRKHANMDRHELTDRKTRIDMD